MSLSTKEGIQTVAFDFVFDPATEQMKVNKVAFGKFRYNVLDGSIVGAPEYVGTAVGDSESIEQQAAVMQLLDELFVYGENLFAAMDTTGQLYE